MWLVLTVFSTLGVGVEVYNYRHGTSYLRLDYS
ncbi:phosphatidate cytidylyltransferase synthase [Haloferax elongans ATCC BAA-1513]|uniref:Phosphatidate cytidylyltransferase synthase n=1 Tax=Haloferax elongans ATCC BAA-1513 TaxID=1230453 RepID=M0I0V5_HALEO|nr:phosphatidate cytidylyltransferase synthase [Haloferax elongans ATCC BAA-1513]